MSEEEARERHLDDDVTYWGNSDGGAYYSDKLNDAISQLIGEVLDISSKSTDPELAERCGKLRAYLDVDVNPLAEGAKKKFGDLLQWL